MPRTVFSALAVLATLTLALGSCSKRLTTVDPTYTEPEGRFSPDAQLVVWYDSPVEEFRFRDRNQPPIGPERDPFCPNRIRVDPGDELLGVDEFEAHPRGSINAMILDRTPATAFSPMRRESNGGFRQVLDFPLRPVRKWLDSQWELYAYNDPEPSGFTPATYVARGEISGVESAESPLTNQGSILSDAVGNIEYTGNCLPCDSLFTLRWRLVPGAARYWLHIYQLALGASDNDFLRSSAAAPVNSVKPKDFLVAFAGPADTSYTLGEPPPPSIEVLLRRITFYNQAYQVRVAAVDSRGQLIAYTHGDYGKINDGSNYTLFRLGSVLVQPKLPGLGPPFCQPETGAEATSSLIMNRLRRLGLARQ